MTGDGCLMIYDLTENKIDFGGDFGIKTKLFVFETVQSNDSIIMLVSYGFTFRNINFCSFHSFFVVTKSMHLIKRHRDGFY